MVSSAVSLDCLHADMELRGDVSCRTAFGDELQDTCRLRGKDAQGRRRAAATHVLGLPKYATCDLWIQYGLTGGEGKSNKEIGLEMGLSDKTVKNYLRNLMEKLNLSRRSEAAAYYVRHSRQDSKE